MRIKSIKKAAASALATSLFSAVMIAGVSAQQTTTKPQDQTQPKPSAPPAQSSPSSPSSPSSAETTTISGEVTGGQDNVLVVTDAQKAEHSLTVNSETKVTKAGKAAAATDLKVNAKVTAQAKKGSDGNWTAVSINIEGE